MYLFPPQSVFFISTVTVFLPSQIWILFGIHTETLGISSLISSGAPHLVITPNILLPPSDIMKNRKGKIAPTNSFLYFYCHCFSSIPNLNYLWNSNRDTWYIGTTLFWRSSLVITPTILPPLRYIIQNRKGKIKQYGVICTY